MLSTLIWMPIAGAVLMVLLGNLLPPKQFRSIALIVGLLTLGWTALLLLKFDPSNPGMQLKESLAWLDAIGLTYQLGIDGLSLPLVLLNSFLVCIAIFSSGDVKRPMFYYPLLLLLSGVVSGAFLSQNLLLFFLFYEVELIPLYLLIAIWGGERRAYAAMKFLIYTAISGILLLLAFFGASSLATAGLSSGISFDFEVLRSQTLPVNIQGVLLILLLLGFGIKIPLVPFHTWLPDAHVEASTPISTLLAGVLLKLGTYGLLRFGLGLFPDAWKVLAPWLATWAVVSVLYGCLTAITQRDMKKMVAYSSVGHMGYILLGMAAATPLSLLGATFQMVSHGLISALLFLVVGVVYAKAGTRNLDALNGLLNPERGLPVAGTLMILAAMASAGIPGMVGFIAEFLIFRGSFPVFPVQTLLCMIGTGLTAVYFLILIDQAFFGRLSVNKNYKEGETPIKSGEASTGQMINLPPSLWQDRAPAVLLALVIVILGLQPSWVSHWIEQATGAIALVTG
ncbi:NADH-quinone oxidoreductase subunit M [Tumidithrix elongata RA019]|uniref:NADH-quinone oxidoreductase subunit M n=1 Tax=Tumidithrix elongata BACA0141 TaxID=2716417 RepID=A0AAW9PY60_9CYAN|nr:NADH-quinone oxidoreductase subunit M [Tumidithrix elongata RA019]